MASFHLRSQPLFYYARYFETYMNGLRVGAEWMKVALFLSSKSEYYSERATNDPHDPL